MNTNYLWPILVLTSIIASTFCLQPSASSTDVALRPAFVSDNPRSVYAVNPNDSWNRIFHALFTRDVRVRLSDAFPEGAPFVQLSVSGSGLPSLRISSHKVTRTELGDRAIEPLYPAFLTADGALQVLTEPQFSELTTALGQALDETRVRSPIERALMQADVWAAYDIMYARRLRSVRIGADILKRREQLLSLLKQFVRKLALSSDEIRSLNSNYALAVSSRKLPDLFSSQSGWLEIELLPHRLHDDTVDFRRAARVFVKPRTRVSDPTEFVESLKFNQHHDQVEAVALVVQNLLIDRSGRVVPSPLFSDVQFRFFKNDPASATLAEPRQLELSRRALLTQPLSGGLVEFSAMSPAYLSTAGNDYGFATAVQQADGPIIVPLRTRCTQCHHTSLTHLMTYSIHYIPPVPAVRILSSSNQERAFYVVKVKEGREDFKSLAR